KVPRAHEIGLTSRKFSAIFRASPALQLPKSIIRTLSMTTRPCPAVAPTRIALAVSARAAQGQLFERCRYRMAYWLVSQGQTWRQDIEGGYLWAPKKGAAGRSQFHWETMNEVRAGDVIFSYADKRIIAVATARGTAYDSPRPDDFPKPLWDKQGRRIDV